MIYTRTLILGLLVFFLLRSDLYAQSNCTAVDLRNEHLGAARNQKNISWCYAFTAADILTHYYGLPTKVSASDVAITYNRKGAAKLVKRGKNFLKLFKLSKSQRYYYKRMEHETGFLGVAISAALDRGLCFSRDFPDNYLVKVSKATGKRTKVRFKDGMRDILKMQSLLKKGRTVESLKYYYDFGKKGESYFQSALKETKAKDLFLKFSADSCDGKREYIYRKIHPKFSFRKSEKKTFIRIDKSLNEGKLIGVDYNARLLRYGRTRKYNRLKNLHTSTVVARRFNSRKKRCEYLIRNSYGSYCSSKYYSGYDCEKGHIWVPKKDLYSSLLSFTYIRD